MEKVKQINGQIGRQKERQINNIYGQRKKDRWT